MIHPWLEFDAAISRLKAPTLIRAYCLLSIIAIVTARIIPGSRKRFLSYGARGQKAPSQGEHGNVRHNKMFTSALDLFASVQVPHHWFTHFYVLSLISSLFWLAQLLFKMDLICSMGRFVPYYRDAPPLENSLLCTCLMVIQSVRRLWESYTFSRGSESRMWIGHYMFGLTFYCVVNIATWIQSVHRIVDLPGEQQSITKMLTHFRVVLGLSTFLLASIAQSQAHMYLAGLQKYSLPRHWLFQNLIAPHYTAECVIYFSLAVIAAPAQGLHDGPLWWISLLTTINLGITAHDTKLWMAEKFRDHKIEIDKRYCIVPGLY